MSLTLTIDSTDKPLNCFLGLRNAASIFQRTIDDILREQIGKFCYVYVDDVIISSQDKKTHIKHVEWVLKSLQEANMRVSDEKSRFLRKP